MIVMSANFLGQQSSAAKTGKKGPGQLSQCQIVGRSARSGRSESDRAQRAIQGRQHYCSNPANYHMAHKSWAPYGTPVRQCIYSPEDETLGGKEGIKKPAHESGYSDEENGPSHCHVELPPEFVALTYESTDDKISTAAGRCEA
jgi:hypothetical protein